MSSAIAKLFDPDELDWLKANPAFDERPATLAEFLGPDYLNIEKLVRRRIRAELTEIMGEDVSGVRPAKYPEALITGGIGIGKTTIASIVLPYLAHWTLCLRDPQGYFDLLAGSRIAFMQMSTSSKQALEVVFGDIKARIQHSPWFQQYPYDPNFKNQLRFPKDIWIIPGDSSETTFEGYNILGGIIDEGDSHKVTENKDYAEQGYTTISARITSRFGDRGFLLCIGQMKRSVGFMARKYREFKDDDDKYAVRLAIWDSLDREKFLDSDGNFEVFTYDVKRKLIVPSGVVGLLGSKETLLEIPVVYKKDFRNDPEKALRDLAGIPPSVSDPFISLTTKITAARDRWVTHQQKLGLPPGTPLSPVGRDGRRLETWFRAPDTLQRTCHIDIAYSAKGDALGFAMGHVPRMVERDGELKPYIRIDMLARMKALPGSEIFLSDVRQLVYHLRSDLGFRLVKATLDGFESTDTIQQFKRKRMDVEYVSVDRDVLPYHDLREAIYEDRIEFPEFIVDLRRKDGSTEESEILVRELSELMDTGRKIDHPPGGSKDVADAVAGVVYTLMGDSRFKRKTVNLQQPSRKDPENYNGLDRKHPAVRGDFSVPHAPLPPTTRRI